MQIRDIFDGLLSTEYAREARTVFSDLDATKPQDWRALAAVLAVMFRNSGVRTIAISGGQGSGKSTLGNLIVEASAALGRKAVCASLDDFYLTRLERKNLAERVHPMLATRGVPGTHDVALCVKTLGAAQKPGSVLIPRFDKALDERCPEIEWVEVQGPVDMFVLEGWCVGAGRQPVSRLETAANSLEAEEDSEGIWRAFVNDMLVDSGEYRTLWAMFEYLVFLSVPDMSAVSRWRMQQERALPASKRMESPQLRRFIAHYERLTTWMLESIPDQADMTVKLSPDHTVTTVDLKVR